MAYDFHGAFETFVGHYSPLYASSLDTTDEEKTLNVVSIVFECENNNFLQNKIRPREFNIGLTKEPIQTN